MRLTHSQSLFPALNIALLYLFPGSMEKRKLEFRGHPLFPFINSTPHSSDIETLCECPTWCKDAHPDSGFTLFWSCLCLPHPAVQNCWPEPLAPNSQDPLSSNMGPSVWFVLLCCDCSVTWLWYSRRCLMKSSGFNSWSESQHRGLGQQYTTHSTFSSSQSLPSLAHLFL